MLAGLKKRLAKKINGYLRYYEKDSSMNDTIDRLRSTGMKIGQDVVVYDSTFDAVYPWLITIGSRCTLTRAEMLVHDDSLVLLTGHRFVAPVSIGDDVFIGRGAIVMPGVTIGSKVIVGAEAIVTKDVPNGCVVAGNPAKVIASIEEVITRKQLSGRLIPHRFQSNLVHNDEDAEVAKLVLGWANTGFKDWGK